MVNRLSIILMYVSLIISIGLPLVLVIYFYIKEKISLKVVFVGIGIFIVFSQVLEKGMHYYILIKNPQTAALLKNTWLYSLYGGLAAGIFEEVGRFIGFKYLLKGRTEWKDGIAYGIGHGGIEAILLGGAASIQYIVFSNLINTGMFEKIVGSKLPASNIIALKQTLINSVPVTFAALGLERLFALAIQIALSLLVLYAVKNRKIVYLLYAIVIHALIDIPAAIYQSGQIRNIWIIEFMIAILAFIALTFIIKAKNILRKDA